MISTRKARSRRYLRLVLGAVVLCALAIGAVNTTVNPWRLTPTPWQAKELEPYRGQTERLRTRKAGLLRTGDWQVALVGSSRIAYAFDPEHPGWGGKQVINLGTAGAFLLHESTAIGHHLLEHEPVEMIVLGIDPGDLTSPADSRPMFDFYNSPFAPDAGIDAELGYVFGFAALDDSLEVVSRYRRGITGPYGPKGMRIPNPDPNRSLIQFIATNMIGMAKLETSDAGGPGRPVNHGKLAKLRALAEACQARGCRLVLMFHANHALMHAESAHRGQAVTPFETERRLLAGLVTELAANHPDQPPVVLWDFCNYHPLHCEPLPLDDPQRGRLKNWHDLGHFTAEVGGEMLAMMLGWPRRHPEWDGIGRKLDAASVDGYLREVAEGYQRYLTVDGVRDVEWKDQVKGKARH